MILLDGVSVTFCPSVCFPGESCSLLVFLSLFIPLHLSLYLSLCLSLSIFPPLQHTREREKEGRKKEEGIVKKEKEEGEGRRKK